MSEKIAIGEPVVEPIPAPPAEVQLILDKVNRGDELTVEEHNIVLAMECASLQKQLDLTRSLLNSYGMRLCALVQFYHKGAAKMDKAMFDNFFTEYNARATIGTENVSGDYVVQVLVQPRKGAGKKTLILPTAHDRKEVERTKT